MKELDGIDLENLTEQEIEELYIKVLEFEKDRADNPLRYFEATYPQKQVLDDGGSWIHLFLGGNASGKSYLGAYCTAMLISGYVDKRWGWNFRTCDGKPPVIWVCGVDYTSVWNTLIQQLLLPMIPKNITYKENKASYSIQFSNGAKVVCKSYDSSTIKFASALVDFCWLDEIPRKDQFDECKSRVNRRRGKILLTLTPLYG